MFHPLRDPQLQFKSEKYKLNKNMEDIIKCNIKKKKQINNKNLVTQKQEVRQVTYMLVYLYVQLYMFNLVTAFKHVVNICTFFSMYLKLLRLLQIDI